MTTTYLGQKGYTIMNLILKYLDLIKIMQSKFMQSDCIIGWVQKNMLCSEAITARDYYL